MQFMTPRQLIIKQVAPLIRVLILYPRQRRYAGVVDEAVNRTVERLRLGDRIGDCRSVTYVDSPAERTGNAKYLEPISPTRKEQQRVVGGRKGTGSCGTDAASCTSDHNKSVRHTDGSL